MNSKIAKYVYNPRQLKLKRYNIVIVLTFLERNDVSHFPWSRENVSTEEDNELALLYGMLDLYVSHLPFVIVERSLYGIMQRNLWLHLCR